jgi:hypothetical protein
MKKPIIILLLITTSIFLLILAIVETDKKEFNKALKENPDRQINDKSYFDLALLKKVSNLAKVNPPSYVIALSVYLIDTGGSILKTTIGELQSIYTLLYRAKYSGFDGFLFDALNEKIRVHVRHVKADSHYFPTLQIDSNITSLYRGKNLEGLIDKYCAKEDDSYVLRKASLTPTEINSISYYFFRNQFMQVNDDYVGSITFIRFQVLLNKYSD